MFHDPTHRKYSFQISGGGCATDTFAVVSFSGVEALSRPYLFTLELAAEEAGIEPAAVLKRPASFTIHRGDGDDMSWHGMVLEFTRVSRYQTYTFYRARLAPKLEWCRLTHHHQIFLDQAVPEFLEAVLRDGGLLPADYSFRLQQSYSPREYVCQYGESHLDFLHRWMEREGLYYYFEQGDAGETAVVTDTQTAHTPLPQGGRLLYLPPSGLTAAHQVEVVHAFAEHVRLLPRAVQLKDYNDQKPSLELTVEEEVDPNGRGVQYAYGENYATPEDGTRLARLRAEELRCRGRVYRGESTVPYLMPGYTFELDGHFRPALNRDYLVVETFHEGHQTGYLLAGLQTALAPREEQLSYRNRFGAIPGDVQFRTERTTRRPFIDGTIPARVDAEGSGQYAELDEEGRYKARLAFDCSGKPDGHASCWLRMAQPYAGPGHGMHLPLRKGTEVLVAFTGGDPDRPYIAGAVPNPETASVVTSANATKSVIQTASGNQIHFEDNPGNERILLHVPESGTFMRLGAPNDPGGTEWDGAMKHYTDEETEESGLAITAGANLTIHMGAGAELIAGNKATVIGGLEQNLFFGLEVGLMLGFHQSFEMTGATKWRPRYTSIEGVKGHLETVKTKITNTQREVAAAHAVIDTINARVAQKTTSLHEAAGRVNGATETVNREHHTISGIKTTVHAAAGTLADHQQAVTADYQHLGAVKNSVIDMERATAGSCRQVAQVRTAAGELDTKTSQLHSKIGTVCTEVAEANFLN